MYTHTLATTLTRKQMIVITWGRLRGAVGLALALVVAQTSGQHWQQGQILGENKLLVEI